MPARQERSDQQVKWNQFLSTVRKDIVDNAKFVSPEGFTLKFFLSMQFLQQEEGARLPEALTQQTLQLAESQADWSGIPLRSDITTEETDALRVRVRENSQSLEQTKKAIADSDNYVTVNYPKLIEGVMECIRLRGHTRLPDEAMKKLRQAEQEEPMVLFADALIEVFDALNGRPPEESQMSLPGPVQIAPPVEVVPQELFQKADEALPAPTEPEFEPDFVWKDLGVDPQSPDYQGINTALRMLIKKLPLDFPTGMSTKAIFYKLWQHRQAGDETSVFVWLNDVFSNKDITSFRQEVSEIHIARILSMLLWDGTPGWQRPHSDQFREHAREIQAGRARTLYPVQLESHPVQPTYVPNQVPEETTPGTAEAVSGRFPRNDEEIAAFITLAKIEIERRTKEEHFSTEWPMSHGQCCNLVSIPMEFCDNAIKEKLVKPDMKRENPRFSELNYIQLLALWRYKSNYGMKSRDVGKTLERFEEIYDAKFGKK